MIHVLDQYIQYYQSSSAGGRANQQRRKEEEKKQGPEYYRTLMEAKDNSEGGEVDINKLKDAGKGKRNMKTAIWRKKVARYLSYCLDGGLL